MAVRLTDQLNQLDSPTHPGHLRSQSFIHSCLGLRLSGITSGMLHDLSTGPRPAVINHHALICLHICS